MRTMIRLLYDFALAEGDDRLADLLLIRGGAPALSLRKLGGNPFAERAFERIARHLGLS